MKSKSEFDFSYQELTLARFRFTFWAETAIHFNTLPASHWRSALGSLLFETSPASSIPVHHQTVYQKFFYPVSQSLSDKRDPVRPIILSADPWLPTIIPKGALFHLEVTIFGSGYEGISTLLRAILDLQEIGIGDERSAAKGRFRVLSLDQLLPDHTAKRLFDPWRQSMQHHWEVPIMKQPASYTVEAWLQPMNRTFYQPHALSIHFVRPLNFKIKGIPIQPKNFTFSEFIRALHRRYQDLLCVLGTSEHGLPSLTFLLEEAEEVEIISNKIGFQDEFKRFSLRQMQEISLSGITGQWVVEGVSKPLLKFLQAGTLTHCGKNSVMGLGKYELN